MAKVIKVDFKRKERAQPNDWFIQVMQSRETPTEFEERYMRERRAEEIEHDKLLDSLEKALKFNAKMQKIRKTALKGGK